MAKNDDMFSMEVEGLDELVSALDELEASVDDAVEAALGAGALLVENQAKNDVAYDTGTLRRSIMHEVRGDDAYIGPSAEIPYAARIEFGFTGADRLGRVYNQAAQPYMRPALQKVQSQIRGEFVNSINDIIRKVSK